MLLTKDKGVRGMMIRLQCVCFPGGTSGISVKDVPHLQRELRIKVEAVELNRAKVCKIRDFNAQMS